MSSSVSPSPVHETVLENGLTVLLRESRAAPVVTCWVGYRVGARNERPGITGASHWVEHMTFKGSEQLARGDIFRLTARHGGGNNGFTSDDFTTYYETLPADCLDLALHLESQRMAFATFDPEETERERTVILAEREGAENSPHYLLSERLGEAIYTVHPYRWPILGTRADLERITRDELLAHYRTYYAPNNAVLTLVGDFDTSEALARIRHYFEALPPGPIPPPVTLREPVQQEERRVEVRRPGAAPYVYVAYPTPEAGHPDTYPLLMLDALLSGARSISWNGGGYMGRSARLYRALVETRLAVSAGGGSRRMLDPATFGASLTVRDGVNPEQAEAALLRELEGLAENPPSQAELDRVLRQAEAQFAYGRDGVTSQAYALLNFHLLGHWSDLDRHIPQLRAVTREDVLRVAAEYFRPERRTVGWFHPTPEAESVAPRRAAEATGTTGQPPVQPVAVPFVSIPSRHREPSFQPHREVLENGLVLLWSESRDTEAVCLRGSLAAGSSREPLERAGLAGLTASLLRRGTQQRSAQELAVAVEHLGASYGTWGGTEEAGFSAKCLGRDLESILDVLQEVLEQPAFAAEELEKTREEVLTHLREQEDSTRAQASKVLLAALYPEGHPYARFASGTPESVASITQDDLREFHSTYYTAQGLTISVAGALDADRLRAHLSRWFAGRPAAPPQRDWRIAPSSAGTETRLPMPHKSQVDVLLSGPAVRRDHPDFLPLSLVTLILGGLGLMGRLGERVREEQGLAYSVSCRASARLWAGEWHASAAVNPIHVDRALASVREEIGRVREELVTESEFADAVEYLIGSLPLRMETADGVAAYLLNSEYYDLGLDYLWRYPDLIRAQTRESLRDAARRHLDPSRASVAIAGPL